MKSNKKKTKVMVYSKNAQEQLLDINLGTGKVNEVKDFCCVGSKIIKDGRSKNYVKSRIALVKKAFLMKKPFIKPKKLS